MKAVQRCNWLGVLAIDCRVSHKATTGAYRDGLFLVIYDIMIMIFQPDHDSSLCIRCGKKGKIFQGGKGPLNRDVANFQFPVPVRTGLSARL